MRRTTVAVYLLILAGVAAAQNNSASRASNTAGPQLSPDSFSWSQLRKAVINPQSLMMNAAGAGIAQWADEPVEWEQSGSGYGKRFGSRVGQHAIYGSTNYGIALARHENRKFQPSGLQGTWPRLKHAVVQTWWVKRTDGGGKTIALGRIAGNFAAAGISRAWQPDSHRTAARAFKVSFSGMAGDTGYSIVREFWPWKRFRP